MTSLIDDAVTCHRCGRADLSEPYGSEHGQTVCAWRESCNERRTKRDGVEVCSITGQRIVRSNVRVHCPACGYVPARGELIGFAESTTYAYCSNCHATRYVAVVN